jgi:hypothetical protein
LGRRPLFAAAVIGLTVALTLVIGLALGFAPVFFCSEKLHNALRETSGRFSSGKTRQALRSALVVAEMALALVLLAGAGLFGRSPSKLASIDAGFRPEGLPSLQDVALSAGPPRVPKRTPDTQKGQPEHTAIPIARRIHPPALARHLPC